MDLTKEQWTVPKPLIDEPTRHINGQCRPRSSSREVMPGIVWTAQTGVQWADRPDRYPPYQTFTAAL